MNINDIFKIVKDFVINNELSEEEIKKLFNKEIHEAYKEKNQKDDEIKECFESFIIKFYKKKEKALEYLK